MRGIASTRFLSSLRMRRPMHEIKTTYRTFVCKRCSFCAQNAVTSDNEMVLNVRLVILIYKQYKIGGLQPRHTTSNGWQDGCNVKVNERRRGAASRCNLKRAMDRWIIRGPPYLRRARPARPWMHGISLAPPVNRWQSVSKVYLRDETRKCAPRTSSPRHPSPVLVAAPGVRSAQP